jgi:hypothetical protein
MSKRSCIAGALLMAMWLAGCATPLRAPPSAVVTTPGATIVPIERAKTAVDIGRSTKSDIRTALGEALVIHFDNGYEVWVYRIAPAVRSARESTQRFAGSRARESPQDTVGELVILFAPSGVVTKSRIRYDPQDERAS